jgi:hypothetical protein
LKWSPFYSKLVGLTQNGAILLETAPAGSCLHYSRQLKGVKVAAGNVATDSFAEILSPLRGFAPHFAAFAIKMPPLRGWYILNLMTLPFGVSIFLSSRLWCLHEPGVEAITQSYY